MRLETNSPDRKLLARAISEWVHEPVHYDGVPRCSYSIGPFKVERDASITCDDSDAWATLTPFFQNHGWLPVEETTKDSTSTDEVSQHSIVIPLVDFNAESAENLLRMIYARQDLLNAMTQGVTIYVDDEVMNLLNDKPPAGMEELSALLDSETAIGMLKGVSIADGKLTMDFPFDEEHLTDWQYYAKLMNALVDRAKSAHRVNAKCITPADTEMKYFCNSLLNQLGLGGADFKTTRAALLGHLSGYAAFRNADKMEEHKVRLSERRRTERRVVVTGGTGDLKAEDGVGEEEAVK